jgi:hypothetical protein
VFDCGLQIADCGLESGLESAICNPKSEMEETVATPLARLILNGSGIFITLLP